MATAKPSAMATVVDKSSAYVTDWYKALKEVLAGKSSNRAYGLVYRSTDPKSPAYLAAAKDLARAYAVGIEAVTKIEKEILSIPHHGATRVLLVKDHVQVLVGKAGPKDVCRQMQPSPGTYVLLASRFDPMFLEQYELSELPESLRDVPMVIQVGGDALVDEAIETPVDKGTREWRERFVKDYGSLTSAQVAEESGSLAKNQPATASRWIAGRKIFSVDYRGQKLFPKFQFQDGRPSSAVAKVMQIFPPHASGWEVAYFFTASNPNISGRKPYELLDSNPDRVISLAQAYVHPADVF